MVCILKGSNYFSLIKTHILQVLAAMQKMTTVWEYLSITFVNNYIRVSLLSDWILDFCPHSFYPHVEREACSFYSISLF